MSLPLVFRACCGKLCGGQIQLGLTQFNNGTKAEGVAASSKVKGSLGLREHLFGQAQPVISCLSVQEGYPDVAADLQDQLIQLLLGGTGTQVRLSFTGFKKSAVKNRDIYVYPTAP